MHKSSSYFATFRPQRVFFRQIRHLETHSTQNRQNLDTYCFLIYKTGRLIKEPSVTSQSLMSWTLWTCIGGRCACCHSSRFIPSEHGMVAGHSAHMTARTLFAHCSDIHPLVHQCSTCSTNVHSLVPQTFICLLPPCLTRKYSH